MTEIRWCLNFEENRAGLCRGAGGRKLKTLCVWCPCYMRQKKERTENHGKGKDNH